MSLLMGRRLNTVGAYRFKILNLQAFLIHCAQHCISYAENADMRAKQQHFLGTKVQGVEQGAEGM